MKKMWDIIANCDTLRVIRYLFKYPDKDIGRAELRSGIHMYGYTLGRTIGYMERIGLVTTEHIGRKLVSKLNYDDYNIQLLHKMYTRCEKIDLAMEV